MALNVLGFFGARRPGANCASFRESLTPKDTLTHRQSYDTKISKNPFPSITSIHIPSMCSFRKAILRMRRCWSCAVEIILRFSTHINAYFQLQSVNCRYFWPINLNEPKKCLYLFQRISVNRKSNKWLNRRNRIFSKICWQDFMKYIHFVALHIQNNCAKFQRILPKEYG